jgi:ribosome-binding factor A
MNRNPGRRPQRVAEAIRQAVAQFLTAEARDPRIGLVTVTGVKVTADLKRAVVSVTVHGDDEEKQRCLYGLAHAEGAIRRAIAAGLTVKFVPEVVFELDRDLERAARINRLLAELKPPGDQAP